MSAGQKTGDCAVISQGKAGADLDEGRSRGSRLLWGVDRFTGRAVTAFSVLLGGLAWIVISAVFGFPAGWEKVFQTLVAAVTVVMVFVIQHTQARNQAATQRKLDEILRVLPEADNSLLALEHASDDELRATRQQHRQIRRAALAGDGRPPSAEVGVRSAEVGAPVRGGRRPRRRRLGVRSAQVRGPVGAGNGIQPMAAATISCACFWIAARSSGPRKDSA